MQDFVSQQGVLLLQQLSCSPNIYLIEYLRDAHRLAITSRDSLLLIHAELGHFLQDERSNLGSQTLQMLVESMICQ